MRRPQLPSLRQVFNKHTALPAALTICMGIITAAAVSNLIDYPTVTNGAWALISGIFTAVNGNSWKARATGRPFFNLH
jgi:hypothetical protein